MCPNHSLRRDLRYTRALTVLRMFSSQIPLSCNSTHLPLNAVAVLSVYHGKVSRGHHKILHNHPRTEHPENNLIFLKVTQACFYSGLDQSFSGTSLEAVKTISEERQWWSPYRWSQCEQDTVPMAGACLAPCLHFKPTQTSFSKSTSNTFHFPEVKAAASSKPPWNKEINETTLKTKQLTRDPGWHNPLDLFPQLSPGLEFLLPKHTPGLPGGAAVGLQLSGDTANRAQTLGCAGDWGGVVLLLHEIPGIVQQGIPACIWSGSNSPNSLPVTKEDCHQFSSLLPAARSAKVRWRSLSTSVQRSPYFFLVWEPNTKLTCQITWLPFKKRNIQYWTKENSMKNLVVMLFPNQNSFAMEASMPSISKPFVDDQAENWLNSIVQMTWQNFSGKQWTGRKKKQWKSYV